MAIENELKFEGGVPSGKLNVPPKSCIPRRAKIRMNRKSRSKSEMMDFIELRRDITRFRSEDQYLEQKYVHQHVFPKCFTVRFIHCEFEDPEKPESPQDIETERARFRLEVSPDDLEDGARDDEAVEAVETRLEVDPRTHGPHPQEHLEDEETQEHKLGRV